MGFTNFPPKDDATFKAAIAAGPSILAEVLKTAIADRKIDLAAAAVMALAQVTDSGTVSHRPAPSAGQCALCTWSPCPVHRS